jgi:hypothetical protein
MDAYITVNHKISEVIPKNIPSQDSKTKNISFQDEYSQFEANDPFIQNFIVQIDALFIPFKVSSFT